MLSEWSTSAQPQLRKMPRNKGTVMTQQVWDRWLECRTDVDTWWVSSGEHLLTNYVYRSNHVIETMSENARYTVPRTNFSPAN
jgi:hypothetical protein